MWRIFGLIFYNEKEKFYNRETKTIDKEGIQRLLEERKIGVGETVKEAVRTKGNASDKFLEIVKPVDLQDLFSRIPECNDFVTTGEKAASVISKLTKTMLPRVGENIICKIEMPDGREKVFRHWRMPSTSRAYPMKTENKAEFYKKMFEAVGVLKKFL